MLTVQEEQRLRDALFVAAIEKAALQAEMDRLLSLGSAAFLGVSQMSAPVKTLQKAAELPKDPPIRHFHTTGDQIRALILACPRGRVEAALLKLESLQTQGERYSGETLAKNGRGFSKKHYTSSTKTMIGWIKGSANRWEGGKHYRFSLLKNQGLKLWANDGLQIVMSYCRQLAEVSNEEGNLDWLAIEA
jgi:hypothetical protein